MRAEPLPAGYGERKGCAFVNTNTQSERSWLVTLLLCIFLGIFGIHRFYAGKVGTGLIQLFTAGGLGIWWLVDLILILFGEFRDAQGLRIRPQ